MRSAASSSVNDLNNAFAGQTAEGRSLGPSSRPAMAIKRRNIPGHWNRPKKTKQEKTKQEKTKHAQSIPKTGWLLERPDDDDVEITDDGCYSDYALTDVSVLLKAEIDLKSDQNEDVIRGKLQTVFEKRYPGIGLCDFEFVKRERNVITTPIVKDNHTWDFSHVKHLCGNGRLYVRLITDIDEISGKALDKCQDDTASAAASTSSTPTSSQAYSNVDLCNATSATTVNETSAQPPHSAVVDVDEAELLRPSGAINSMVDQQRVDNLAMMFPRIPRDVIRNAVVTCASMNTAVNVLLQYGEIDDDSNPSASGASTSSDNNSNIETQDSPAQTVGSLPFVLQNLRRNMKSREMREKLKVDPEDEVMDVYCYYKSSLEVFCVKCLAMFSMPWPTMKGSRTYLLEVKVENFLFSATNLLSMAFMKLWVK